MPERKRRTSRAGETPRTHRDRPTAQALLDAIAAAVLVARPPGTIEMMNAAARELAGVGPGSDLADLLARLDVRDAATNEPLRRPPLGTALAGEDVVAEVSFTDLRDGVRRVARVSARPVRAPGGAIVAAVAVLDDVTGLRRAEGEQEELLSLVSHELRTPLTPLKAHAQLLASRLRRARERGEAPDLAAVEQGLAAIERQADRMNGLVGDLVLVSRAGRGAFVLEQRPFDLAAAVRDVVERCAEAAREEGRHTFAVDAPGTLAIRADQERIERLLTNLIANAVKYSPRGGAVRVSLARHDATARVVIADEGIGIEPADLARLGAAFTRGTGRAATFAGMGIGLHVAKLVAEAHGGTLEIASAGVDRGTTVRVDLPA